jgi:hypothetical protein
MSSVSRTHAKELAGIGALVALVCSTSALARSATSTRGPLSAHQERRANLITPGDRVQIVYAVDTPHVRSPRGSLYVRNDLQRGYIRLPLTRRPGGTLQARVPARLIRGHRLLYYGVIRDPRSGHSVTVPAHGARAPSVSWILDKPVVVRLGTHQFGQTREPEAVVARARASEVGWRDPPPGEGPAAGPQSFLIARDGSVWLDDEVNGRLLVWEQGRPDDYARSVAMPLGSDRSDIAFGPGGTLYVTRILGTGRATHIALDRLTGSGETLWEARLGGVYSPLAQMFALGVNSPLRTGPDGTLYCLVFMGLLGDEWGWMPVATPGGRPLAPAAQRRGTHWPFQPVAGGLRLIGPETYSPHEDLPTHEVRYALIDRRDRVVSAWRVFSSTEINFHMTVPDLVGSDPVVVFDFMSNAGGVSTWEYEVLRLGPRGARVRLSLPHALWGETIQPDLRVGPDGKLYQLTSSRETGVVVSRYSLG